MLSLARAGRPLARRFARGLATQNDAPLKGVKVLELAGLAPAPFAGMILSDFGADVVRVDRQTPAWIEDTLCRGKRSIALDMKHPLGKQAFLDLAAKADVLIEPFRPGVMEKLGFGPDQLLAANPGLIYARLTGFGQTGRYSAMAGHDANYIAASGIFSILGRKDEVPTPPVNLLADFAGGGMTCALGIMMALFEKSKSGKGQVVDAAMVGDDRGWSKLAPADFILVRPFLYAFSATELPISVHL